MRSLSAAGSSYLTFVRTILTSRCFLRTSYLVHGLERLLHQADAVKQAEVLGIAERTMARWISNLVQIHDLERISHGIYRKINPINHSA
jgi:hypothetical protein